MGLQDISLPVDVPWTLIATSNDMLADHDTRFPHAMWKSSLAVFKFDPDPADLPEVEEYKGRALTFLKVVCSITSYTPPCTECPPPPEPYTIGEDFGAAWEAEYASWKIADEQCQTILHQTYPCSGALVQVAVYPKASESTDVTQLAYFASFEPKKRELIEVATESGESLTQSKSDINVRKGVTSTNSTEDLDVFTGANLNVGVAGVSVGAGVSGQWGTIKRSGAQHDNVTTTDAARERRESSSHTTSISQLYHLLNSYHQGTNRAIFFLQSRPHTLQQKDRYTFIDGPQEIEGVQEFFLVLSRPIETTIDDYCVDALLYTGHLDVDAMRNAIMEPKTAETQWLDLWATAPPLPHGGGGLSWWQFLIPIPIPGVNDPVTLIQDMGEEVQNKAAELEKMWDDMFGDQPDHVDVQRPAILDGYLTPAALNDPQMNTLNSALAPPLGWENGWRIDRTRGLGGYDLWEDPNNRSADSRGKYDSGKPPAKPEAFVDIVSSGSPDDLTNYHPDYALRFRAFAWPWGADDGQAIYHGRIKAYFIRNDLPTTQRTLDMLVAVRGVSTCGDSPFFDYHPDQALRLRPEIITEAKIHPPSIAPWRRTDEAATGLQDITIVAGAEDAKIPRPPGPRPINSARPSGLEPVAIGAARAKMANGIGDLVHRHLVSALRCLPEREKPILYDFVASDLYFNRIATTYMKLEINKMASSDDAASGLGRYVSMHRAVHGVMGPNHPTVAKISERFMRAPEPSARGVPASDVKARVEARARAAATVTTPPRPEARMKLIKPEVKPSKKYPLLTLASSKLAKADHARLQRAAIRSTLDLIDLPARDLARRIRTDETEARQLRLRILGIDQSDLSGE